MKIKDNSSIAKEKCAAIVNIAKVVADKTLDDLEKAGVFVFPSTVKEAEDITKDQILLQSYNNVYRTGNVMGFLGLGKERLIIESRFSRLEDDFFFQYLLEKVLEFPNVLNNETDGSQEEKIFSLLIFLFPKYLRDAARKGLFKTYIREECNDENIKGTIDIARHIRENTPFTGRIAYCQRVHSLDNYLIELIRHTIEFIKRKNCGNRILEAVKDEVKLVVEATRDYKVANRRRIIEANKRNIIAHAYYYEYRYLQQLCVLILQNAKHQMGAGSNKVYGILFDGAWLWEEYVNKLIGKAFYHPMNKSGKFAQRLFADGTGLIYPDFISRDANDRVVADAKYKPIQNIGNKDYLQVLAYMYRFDAKSGYYLYPEAGEMKARLLILNQGSTFEENERPRAEFKLIKHGLKIPNNAENYAGFVEAMKQSEITFIEAIMK